MTLRQIYIGAHEVSGCPCKFIYGSMRFRGLADRPSNSYAGPWGLGVSLALLHIYIRVHEDPGSNFKFIYGHMRFRGLFDLWLDRGRLVGSYSFSFRWALKAVPTVDLPQPVPVLQRPRGAQDVACSTIMIAIRFLFSFWISCALLSFAQLLYFRF